MVSIDYPMLYPWPLSVYDGLHTVICLVIVSPQCLLIQITFSFNLLNCCYRPKWIIQPTVQFYFHNMILDLNYKSFMFALNRTKMIPFGWIIIQSINFIRQYWMGKPFYSNLNWILFKFCLLTLGLVSLFFFVINCRNNQCRLCSRVSNIDKLIDTI